MSILVPLIFAAASAFGAKHTYPEQKFSSNGVQKIEISGVKGEVKVSGRAGKAYRLKVKHSRGKKYEDWSLAVDRRGEVLVLEVSSAVYGAQWRKHVRQDQWPEFDVELSGPPVPLIVSWKQGQLHYSKWSADIESSHLKGDLTIEEGVGNYDLHTGMGDVQVAKLAGELKVQGESGNVTIDQVTGAVTLNWLSGNVKLKTVMGGGKLDLNESKLTVDACRGEWSIQLARGQAEIEGCSGKLMAEGQSTAWRLRKNQDLETEIKSGEGPVAVEWNSGGAKVFLTSNQGVIEGPKVQSKLDSEGRKVAEFTVGKKPFSAVFVRTESGPILFK
jgi:DUF4097 and DUF4098 domain-containing protein YvlB